MGGKGGGDVARATAEPAAAKGAATWPMRWEGHDNDARGNGAYSWEACGNTARAVERHTATGRVQLGDARQ